MSFLPSWFTVFWEPESVGGHFRLNWHRPRRVLERRVYPSGFANRSQQNARCWSLCGELRTNFKYWCILNGSFRLPSDVFQSGEEKTAARSLKDGWVRFRPKASGYCHFVAFAVSAKEEDVSVLESGVHTVLVDVCCLGSVQRYGAWCECVVIAKEILRTCLCTRTLHTVRFVLR